MTQKNMVKVYAPIEVQEEVARVAREKASVLALPEEKQADLLYVKSMMVSAGTNKNGAHFLPSEMMKAHNTIVHKALDIEHEEDKVIGHIYDCAFVYKDGTQLDPRQVLAEYKEAGSDPDDLDIDIITAGIVHKMRFPEIAQEIARGEWKVSMECFFRDFDIKIGGQIISRQEAQALGYDADALIGGFVKVVAGKKALGKHFVARVLRDITFSGIGFVKNPANPHSIVMETAAHRELRSRGDLVIDLEHIDNFRGTNRVEIRSEVAKERSEEMPPLASITAFTQDGFSSPAYIEVDKKTGGIKRILSAGSKEEAALRFTGPGIGGPGTVNSFPDNICKSFKKRVTKFNALDQSEGVVLHEHWCALFEQACPVIGASAKAPECLRNQFNRTTRDSDDNTLTKSLRENIQDAPGNTFVTTLLEQDASPSAHPPAPAATVATSRLRQQARDLRNSLREYTGAQKKTLE